MNGTRLTAERSLVPDLRDEQEWAHQTRGLLSDLRVERLCAAYAAQDGNRWSAVLRRQAAYKRALGIGDLVAAVGALFIAILVLSHNSIRPSAVVVPLLVVLVNKAVGLYDRDEHLLKKTTLEEIPSLVQISAVSALLVLFADDLVMTGDLGGTQTLGFWVLLLALMVVTRWVIRRVIGRWLPTEQCLILGDEAAANRVQAKIALDRSVRAQVVGRVLLPGRRAGEEMLSKPGHFAGNGSIPIVGEVYRLPEILRERHVDRVIVAPSTSDSQLALEAIRLIKLMGIKVSVFPRLFEVVGSSIEFDDLGGLTLLGLRRDGLTRSSWVLKRSVDVLGAGFGLVLLSPIMLAIAVAIKLTSRGPVFFSQRRIGRRDREFRMLKFRTMVDGADGQKDQLRHLNEAVGLFKIGNDPRVTSVGRLLRRTSMDELPQLLNVLRGDMSLVGPRPLVPDEDSQVEGFDRTRLHLVPGMTGPWQVRGSSAIPLSEMVKIDYLYAANWSLWTDSKILLRTIAYAFSGRGR